MTTTTKTAKKMYKVFAANHDDDTEDELIDEPEVETKPVDETNAKLRREKIRCGSKFEVGKFYVSDEETYVRTSGWHFVSEPCNYAYQILKRTKKMVTVYDQNNDDWHHIDEYYPDDEIPGEFDCIFRKRIQLDEDGNEYVEWKDEEGELVTLSAKKETQDPNPWLRDEEPENNDDTDDKPEDDELIGEPEENTATEETLVAYTREIPQDETFKVREFVIGDELDGDVISFYKDRWIKIYSKTHGATIRRNGFDPDDNRIYFDTKPFYANRQQYLYKEDCTEEEFWRAMVERGVVTVNEPKEPCRPFTVEAETVNVHGQTFSFINIYGERVTFVNGEVHIISSDKYDAHFNRQTGKYVAAVVVDGNFKPITFNTAEEFFAEMVKRGACTIDEQKPTPKHTTDDELNQPSKDDLRDSLERAAEIARQKYHEYERDGNEAGMLSEIELYSICTDAIKELEVA